MNQYSTSEWNIFLGNVERNFIFLLRSDVKFTSYRFTRPLHVCMNLLSLHLYMLCQFKYCAVQFSLILKWTKGSHAIWYSNNIWYITKRSKISQVNIGRRKGRASEMQHTITPPSALENLTYVHTSKGDNELYGSNGNKSFPRARQKS